MCAQQRLKTVCAALSHKSLCCPHKDTALLVIQTASSEDSDQPAHSRRLIWIFAGRTCSKVRFLTFKLIDTYNLNKSSWYYHPIVLYHCWYVCVRELNTRGRCLLFLPLHVFAWKCWMAVWPNFLGAKLSVWLSACSVSLCCFVVYCKRRFVLGLTLCYFFLVFISPFSIAITSLTEERANLSVFFIIFFIFYFFFYFIYLFYFFIFF